MKETLRRPLKEVRRKIQLERLLRGAAFLVVFVLLASTLSAYLLAENNFSDRSVLLSRLILGLGILLIGIRFVLVPLLRLPSMSRIARFLEERYPDLADRLSTAVEIDSPTFEVHPAIRSLIQHDAGRSLRKIDRPRFFWPQLSTIALSGFVLSTVVLSFLFLVGPEVYRYSLGKLLGGWGDDGVPPLYQVLVSPGTVTVGERTDLKIRAETIGFEASAATLMARYQGNPQWEPTKMLAESEMAGFSFLFFDIREPIDYYVESEGIRSETFRISISDFPRVDRLELTLEFPGYTGLSPVTLEDEGDIRALKGTLAHLKVFSNQPVDHGSIAFENSDDIPLTPLGEKEFEASFEITRDDFYRVQFSGIGSAVHPASDDFLIEALEDQEPLVSFNYPGRDKRVTNIEEVFTELKAEDDYGIRSLNLHFSVNGGSYEKLPLPLGGKPDKTTTSHTFYLEEYDLLPGDFISYYGEASDSVTSSTTDIFFLEVQPYEREYTQSQMEGSAAGGQQGLELSRQQKQIVVATFSLTQEKERLSPEELKENSQTLALVQQRLAQQVTAIKDRIERRGVASTSSRFQKMSEYMSEALVHMQPAEESLNAIAPEKALPEEQKALQQLLRSEALFNEMQIAMSRNSGGQGASPEELADLVDLELDRTKNQYETLQQNRENQQDQSLDEALEKLKQLAKRQEQQAERKQRAMQGGSGTPPTNGEMVDEVERLARELARLSRERRDQRLNEISRQLNRAAREMKQANTTGQSGQESSLMNRQAAERLQKAAEELLQQRESQVREALDRLKDDSQRLVQEQKEVIRGLHELERLTQRPPGPQPGELPRVTDEYYDRLRQLYWQKQELREALQELEGDLHQSARRLRGNEPETARRLKEAALGIRDERLPDKMQEGADLMANGLVNLARHREEGVEEELSQLAQDIRAAERTLGSSNQESSEEKLRSALNETGELVDRLESLSERIQTGNASPGSEGAQEGRQPGENQSQQAQSGRGSPAEGDNQQPSGFAGGSGSTGINPRQAGREWQERLREATRLQERLRDEPGFGPTTSQLLRRMRQLDINRLMNDPDEIARLKEAVIDGFLQLELEINRTLQGQETGLRPVDQDEIPAEFREQVEEYYRRLSSRRPE
jgi:hypothetical protein